MRKMSLRVDFFSMLSVWLTAFRCKGWMLEVWGTLSRHAFHSG